MPQPYRISDQIISDAKRSDRPPAIPRTLQVPFPSGEIVHVPPVVSLIGDTPLVPLHGVRETLASDVTLYVKLEGCNPGGSVKDRTALSIIREGRDSDAFTPNQTLLDASSGNTGIAYAMLGAAYGFAVHLALPADVSPERVQILKAYGAGLALTDPTAGTEGARRFVRRLVASEPDRYFHADQYDNPANPLAHFTGTGPEIWRQTRTRITHFVAGIGTGGTMTGVGGYLRQQMPGVKLIGVQPERPEHGISGLKHLATAELPRNYDGALVDWTEAVSTAEAEGMARRLARREGLFVGISAGAAVVAAVRVAQRLERGVVVALLADGGFKYTSAPFWTA